MSRPILHAYFLSSCSWRVRISLAHKGVEHDIKVVSTSKTREDEYLQVNPAGQIPVLQVGDAIIAESIAILEYIEEVYPEKPLLPKAPLDRAKVREICELLATGIQPLQNPGVAKRHSADPEKQSEWTFFYINRGFTALEKILNKTSTTGKFCFGDSLTHADCCLVPQVYNAVERFKIDMSPYPKILNIYNALLEIEAVSQGHPDNKF